MYTAADTSHAAVSCHAAEKRVNLIESDSARIVARAAAHGGYSRINVRNASPEAGVNAPAKSAP